MKFANLFATAVSTKSHRLGRVLNEKEKYTDGIKKYDELRNIMGGGNKEKKRLIDIVL